MALKKFKNLDVESQPQKAQGKFYSQVQKEWLKTNGAEIPEELVVDVVHFGSSLVDMAILVMDAINITFQGDESTRAKAIKKAIWKDKDDYY